MIKLLTSMKLFLPLCVMAGLVVFGVTYTVSEVGNRAIPDAPGEHDGHSHLQPEVFEAVYGDDVAFLDQLLKEGHDPNQTKDKGWTPLHAAINSAAVSENTFGIVQVLLNHGANPNQPDDEGFSPMHVAAGIDNEAIMTIMLQSGGEPNYSHPEFPTPYEVALSLGNSQTLSAIDRHTILRPDNYHAQRAMGLVMKALRETSRPDVSEEERREIISRTVNRVGEKLQVPDLDLFVDTLSKQAEAVLGDLDDSQREALLEAPRQR